MTSKNEEKTLDILFPASHAKDTEDKFHCVWCGVELDLGNTSFIRTGRYCPQCFSDRSKSWSLEISARKIRESEKTDSVEWLTSSFMESVHLYAAAGGVYFISFPKDGITKEISREDAVTIAKTILEREKEHGSEVSVVPMLNLQSSVRRNN